MKLKQLWQNNIIWFLLVWILTVLIFQFSLLIFGVGVLAWVMLLYLTAPGVFWTYYTSIKFNKQNSEHYLLKAISYQPAIPGPYISLGVIFARSKRWAEAVKVFEEAFRLSNKRSGKDVQIMLAISYRESGNYQRALELMTELLEKGNKTFILYINLATTYFKLNRLEEALETAEKARSINLKSPQPVLLMGRIHFETGEFQKAKDDYLWSIDHMSWPVESYYWLGRAELELKETETAIEHLKKAVERITDDPDMSDVPVEEAQEWLNKAGKLV